MMKRRCIALWMLILMLTACICAVAQAEEADFLWTEAEVGLVITGYTGAGGEITIPASVDGRPVVGVGDWAFHGQSGLTGVTVPEGVSWIGDWAFADCSQLERVSLPDSLTSLGKGAFQACASLSRVEVPVGVTELALATFDGCASLEEITLHEGLTSIGIGALLDCAALTTLTIPESVKRIGPDAFRGCSGLEEITIPGDVTEIDNSSFQGCVAVRQVYVSGAYLELPIRSIHASGASPISVTVLEGVREIRHNAFLYCPNVTSVTLPETVTLIASAAFYYCYGLEEITIPASVTRIEEESFRGCENLHSVFLLGEPSIDRLAFKDCNPTLYRSKRIEPSAKLHPDYLTVDDGTAVTILGYDGAGGDLVIPSEIGGMPVVTIEVDAFRSHKDITSVVIPDTVTTINERAFFNCVNLTEVTLPSTLTEISADLFNKCASLTKIDLTGIVRIQRFAFLNCTSLAEVILDENLEEIGNQAFSGCVSLTALTIPGSLTALNDSDIFPSGITLQVQPDSTAEAYAIRMRLAYSYPDAGKGDLPPIGQDDNYVYQLVGDTYTIIDYCGSSEEIVIPETYLNVPVTRIGAYAFLNKLELMSVVIPGNILSIGDRAFSGCENIRTLVIEEGVIHIGRDAFSKCLRLYDAYIPYSATCLGSIFSLNEFLTLHCYIGSAVEGKRPEGGYPPILMDPPPMMTEGDFEYLVLNDQCLITRYLGQGGAVSIPSTLGGLPVTGINCDVFRNNGAVTSVVVPEGVTNIGNYAFASCDALKEVLLPDGLLFLGASAFAGSAIEEISLPNSLEVLGISAFSGCAALQRITMPDGLATIEGMTFSGCTSLTDVTLPAGLTSINDYAFWNCESLTDVTFLSAETNFGKNAFNNCPIITLHVPEDSMVQQNADGYKIPYTTE